MGKTKEKSDAFDMKEPVVSEAPEPQVEQKYDKRAIVDYYTRYSDYLTVVLDPDVLYTRTQVEKLIKEVR